MKDQDDILYIGCKITHIGDRMKDQDDILPIGSMVLVYLPTKLGHLWGKCW